MANMKKKFKYFAISALLGLLTLGVRAGAVNTISWNFGTNGQGQSTIFPAVNVPISIPMAQTYVASAVATTTAGTLATSSVITQPYGNTTTVPTVYYFKVTALDSKGGETLPSYNELSAAPSSTTSTNEIIVTWGAIPGASSYKLYVGTVSDAENLSTSTTATTFILATTTGLSAATVPSFSTAYVSSIDTKGNETLGGTLTALIGSFTSFTSNSAVFTAMTSTQINGSIPPIVRTATSSFATTTFGSELLATSSAISNVPFPFGGFAIGDPCIVGLSTAPTSTAFFKSAQITDATGTTATATVSYWSDAATSVTVNAGVQKVECHH